MAGVRLRCLGWCVGPIRPGHLTPIAEAHEDEAVVSPLSIVGGCDDLSNPTLVPGLHLHSAASLES